MEFTTHFELHSQTTRLVEDVSQSTGCRVKYGIVTLFDTLFQGTWTRSSTENASIDYNADARRTPAFKFELFPLRSPLLRESLLVSFPPLIDMLKFSGYPYLIRGQPGKIDWGRRRAPAGPTERVTKPHTLEDR